MCGIAGILSLAGTPQQQIPHLVAMTRAMRHRGPDDEGYMTVGESGRIRHFLGADSPLAVRARFPTSGMVTSGDQATSLFAMGHRRLSILDVSSAGHQPMSDSSGRYWIVFNGEIYNFKALRSELEVLGHRFQSSSDTEVILAAYGQWQEGCLVRFNGDFAFAIWDAHQQSLFCARDRIGIKPFYYVWDDQQFVFGSDIKTLIASGLYRPEPDPHGLYLAMAFGIAPRPITAFKGVRALEQAHWMRLHADGRVEKQRYWNIPIGTQDLKMKEGDAVEQLEEQLQRSVARRLVADVPVGTFMSGGIDSTVISAIAARKHPGIKAFTLGYQNAAPEMDEVSQAAATARLHPMEHIVKRVDPEESLEDLQAWIAGYEEPFYSLAANYEISKIVKENQVKVVLNGLGSDELFAGYERYRYSRIPQHPWLRLLAGLADVIPNGKVARGASLFGAQTPDHLHTLLFRQGDDKYLHSLFHSSFAIDSNLLEYIHNLYARETVFGDAIEAMSYMDLMNYVGNHHVHRVDQFTMAHSIEGRFPFFDHELIETAYRIPSRLKIHKGKHKYILRRVAEKHIAKECLTMKKKGFSLPLALWMKGPLEPIVTKSLTRLMERPMMCSDTINRLNKAYKSGHLSPTRIWHLVALELWFERFIDPGVPEIHSRQTALPKAAL